MDEDELKRKYAQLAYEDKIRREETSKSYDLETDNRRNTESPMERDFLRLEQLSPGNLWLNFRHSDTWMWPLLIGLVIFKHGLVGIAPWRIAWGELFLIAFDMVVGLLILFSGYALFGSLVVYLAKLFLSMFLAITKNFKRGKNSPINLIYLICKLTFIYFSCMGFVAIFQFWLNVD